MTARVSSVNNAPNRVRGRPFEMGNRGRPKGSKNKTTQLQLEAAREAFSPMAKRGLDIGAKHLKECGKGQCSSCMWWSKIAFDYAYGKPTQPLDIDAAALREELEKIAEQTGRTVEELEHEAEQVGRRLLRHRGSIVSA